MPPAIPDKLPCESLQQLEQELSTLRDTLSSEETEETWDRIARALTRFSAVVKGGGYKYEKELVNGIKISTRPIVSAMNSERTRLSSAALDCLTIIAPRVGLAFEPLVPLFVPHILRLATRTNKVYVTRSQATLALVVGYCHIPSIIPCLLAACKESKIVTGRAVSVESVLRCLNKWDWTDKEIKAKVGDVEEVIRVTGRDKDAGIRQTSRKVFEAYKTLFPDRVDAFTGPLTPVMRKYLDIKPQRPVSKATDTVRSLFSHDKTKQPPSKPGELSSSTSELPSTTSTNARLAAHSRSASSNAIVPPGPTKSSRSQPRTAGTMAPPASIPPRARATSRPQVQRPKPDHPKPEEHADHERQRVLSTASSNFSVKSAPVNSHSGYEHQPPVRLAASQSRAAVADPAIAASSGPARRVRRVVAVEPHPANRPDFFSVAHKAPVRPTPLGGMSRPQAQKPTRPPGREPVSVVANVPTSTAGIAFPSAEVASASIATVERKGAQRVPKPALPLQATSPKAERPATSMSDTVKREIKTSMFKRGAPGATAGEKVNIEKPKGGFAPRRGGGVMQPTLSQLSKQKTHSSATGTLATGARVAGASVASQRPVWGGGAKPGVLKAHPTSRVLSRNGVAKVPGAKQGGGAKPTEVHPAMVPLPASPGRERDIAPQTVPVSGLSEALQVDEERGQEATSSNGATADEAPEVAQSLLESETNTNELQTDEAQEVTQDPSDEDKEDVFMADANPMPHTPPFPTNDEDSEEDELADIEFTTGEAYDSAGVPIKTPGKVVSAATGVPSERNPLAEVVLNE